jgi:hypothetical protein
MLQLLLALGVGKDLTLERLEFRLELRRVGADALQFGERVLGPPLLLVALVRDLVPAGGPNRRPDDLLLGRLVHGKLAYEAFKGVPLGLSVGRRLDVREEERISW